MCVCGGGGCSYVFETVLCMIIFINVFCLFIYHWFVYNVGICMLHVFL